MEIQVNKPVLQSWYLKRYCIREKGSRLVNLLISLCILVLITPLMAFLAILILFDSPGPVIFKQKRLGRNGKPFTLYKFRSMFYRCDQSVHQRFVAQAITSSDKPLKYRIKDDPRITRVGRWLRKLSLDELPQFFNVLKGDIDTVGPRPLLDYESEYFKDWHWQRQMVKPGITGLYQVRARGTVPFDEMVRMDLEYIKNYTLWLNLRLMLETIFAVIKKTGG